MKNFDLIVIGGGPGGYVAAIRASQLGLNVACIDKRPNFGGTCLNVGCIPSKALLHSSHMYNMAKNHMSAFGINIKGNISVDLDKMMASKERIIRQLTGGVSHLLKKYKVEAIIGSAKLEDENTVVVDNQKYKTQNILIATGSTPTTLPGVDIDEKNIVTSDGAISFNKIPETMAVIGGGYIGLELGSVWKRLGSKVTVIEFLDGIVPTMDKDAASILFSSLAKQGIRFLLETKVMEAKEKGGMVEIKCVSNNTNKKEIVKVEKVLLAVGRKPYTEELGLREIGLKLNKNGTILVNENFATSLKGIYAIGDVINGPMLAHKASAEGHAFAEKIAGTISVVNYDTIPAVIYTEPEVAWVGNTEEELVKKKISFRKGIFPFSANARGRTTGDTEGSIKILVDDKTDRIVGVHIVGAHAGELIGEAVTAIDSGLSGEDLALMCHAHPTLSESFKEAASLASHGFTIHS